MREPFLRKWHRYLAVVVAPLILLQTLSGLLLTVDFLFRYQRQVHGFLAERDLAQVAELWDLFLFQLHFGATRVGYLTNIAVGLGLLVLIATGVPIFVLVQARLVRRWRGVTQAEAAPPPTPGEGWEAADWPRPRKALAALLSSAAILAVLSVYAFYRSYTLSALHVPHAQAAADLQVEVLEAHTALEELLATGGVGRVDVVWDRLESARRMAEELLSGVRAEGLRIPALGETTLRQEMEEIRTGIGRLQDLTVQRYVGATPSVPESPGARNAYLETLHEVNEGLQAFRGNLVGAVLGDQERLLATSVLLLSAAFLVTVVLAVSYYRYEAERVRHLELVHEARERAEEGEEFFRQVVQQAADPFLVFSPDGRVIDANRLACAWLGYGREELLALSVAEVLEDCPWEEMAATWARMEPGAPVSVRARHLRRDGSTVPAVANQGLLRWGERRLILHLAREVGGTGDRRMGFREGPVQG
ncbi:MAG: PAS domain S-box protein [Deferrisomatales bacterium]